MFFATPARADEVVDATVALDAGNALVVDLTIEHDIATAVVTSAEEEVISAQTSLDVIDETVETISNSVTDLQTTYDTQVITSVTYTDNSLTATVYNDRGYNGSPPLGAGTIVSTQQVAEINFQWGGGSVLGGPAEDVQIKFEGTLTAPETKEYSFYGPADDGFILKINGETIIQDWVDKGGGGSISAPVLLTEGVANQFEAWYYENGGGAWVQLNWYDNGWKVIPATAFDTPQLVETKDPNVLILLNNAKTDLELAEASQVEALEDLNAAIEVYNDALEAKNVVYENLESAIAAIPTLQQNLEDVVEAKRIADAEAAEAARLAEQARLDAIAAQEAADRAAAEARAATEAKAKAEAEALAKEQARLAEEARIAAEKAAAEAAAAKAQAEEDARIAAEKAAQEEADRIAAEALAIRLAGEAAEAERLAALEAEKKNQPEPTPEPEIKVEKPVIIEPQPKVENPPIVEPEKEQDVTVQEATIQLEERSAKNDTGIMSYTVADVVTELQAEQVLQVFTNPAAAVEALGESLAATAEFVGELFTDPGAAVSAVFENVSAAGLDMSDDQREKAQEVIIPVVIVSQIASMVIGRIK